MIGINFSMLCNICSKLLYNNSHCEFCKICNASLEKNLSIICIICSEKINQCEFCLKNLFKFKKHFGCTNC